MNPKQWKKVSELFDQVMELPETQREAFLRARCGDHTLLRREVVKLIKAASKADLLQDIDRQMSHTLTNPPAVLGLPTTGDQLDRYKLLEEIGRGGMGVVYRATDETFKRQVAIKLIHEGRATQDARRRLRIESQVLANLEHPNIATLHDGGATPEGLPYLVMEHVAGTPIDDYCDQNDLTTEQRLDLFLNVCDAVESAHRSLIVHRDIKPSNILVNSEGVPKLLDFGIAKLLEPDHLGIETEATATGRQLLTLDYASVEQIAGRPVTVASDVYSLGVLLYKLLVGRLPFRFDADGPLTIEQQAFQREPPRASGVLQRAGEARQARDLAGDLDSILIKALRSAPEHRYGTVAELVADLRRYRHHLPVQARRGNFQYLAAKFLRRHRVGVGFAALLAIFTVLSLLQVVRIQQERARADVQQQARTFVVDLLTEVFETGNLYLNPGDQLTVRQALEYGGKRVLNEQIDIESQTVLLEVVGRVLFSLGDYDPASEYFHQAVEVQTRIHGEDSLESARARGLYATSLRQSRIEGAIQEGERAVEIVRHLKGEDSKEMVEPLNQLVASYCFKGDYEAAAALAPKALILTERWFGPDNIETALALHHDAMVLKKQKHWEESRARYLRAAEIYQRHFSETHPYALAMTSNIGSIERALGNLERSVAIYKELLATQEKVYPGEHTDIALTLINLSAVLFDQGLVDEPLKNMDRAIQIYHNTLGADHPYTMEFEIRRAQRLLRVDRPSEAKELLAQRLPSWRLLNLEQSPSVLPRAEEAFAKAEAALAKVNSLPGDAPKVTKAIMADGISE